MYEYAKICGGGGIPQIMTILYTIISGSHILNSAQKRKAHCHKTCPMDRKSYA